MVTTRTAMAPKQEANSVVQPTPPVSAPTPSNTSTHSSARSSSSSDGLIVTHFRPSNRSVQNNGSVILQEFITDDYCVDRESVRSKFGWDSLGNNNHIPYLFRNGVKYCAVRMVEKYIFDSCLTKLSDNIYFGCTNILGYYITVPESILLNEINEFHCDGYFGPLPFKQGDVLVKLEDAKQFYEFLTVCSSKLLNTPCDEKRCGFLTMNEKSIVPYVIINDQKLVPLFYFDGMEGIKFKIQHIKGWDFAYLKFCFKVHGIREEFCKKEECSVIALDDIMQYLDAEDSFKEWWPTIVPTNKAIFQPKRLNKHSLKAWHQNPITVLPVATVKYSKAPPSKTAPPTPSTTSSAYYRTISHS